MGVQPTLDNTWGAALIGLVFSSALYGITTLQLYIYFVKYPNDAPHLKLLAVSAWLLDTTSLGLVLNAMYHYLVTDMANPIHRLFINRTLTVDPAIMGTLALLTHCYLGTRVWNVCHRNIVIGLLLASCSLAAFTLAVASTVITFRFVLWSDTVAIKSLALAGTIIDVFVDIFIACVLCTYLLRQGATNNDLKRIIHRTAIFSINTGLASGIMSTVNVVTVGLYLLNMPFMILTMNVKFVALPHTMIFLGSNFIFSKVYANCLLANLNIREPHRVKSVNGAASFDVSGMQEISAIVYRQNNSPTCTELDLLALSTDQVRKESASAA